MAGSLSCLCRHSCLRPYFLLEYTYDTYTHMLAALTAATCGWPHFLRADGCRKGLELLHSGQASPPVIMNAVPTMDPDILRVVNSSGGAVVHGDSVPLGAPLTLVHRGTKDPHGSQTVFITSAGLLEQSEPCGEGGAAMVCTTCGAGWLRQAQWTPTATGEARLAVGAARTGACFGTPAVTIGSLVVRVRTGTELLPTPLQPPPLRTMLWNLGVGVSSAMSRACESSGLTVSCSFGWAGAGKKLNKK